MPDAPGAGLADALHDGSGAAGGAGTTRQGTAAGADRRAAFASDWAPMLRRRLWKACVKQEGVLAEGSLSRKDSVSKAVGVWRARGTGRVGKVKV